MKAITIRCVCGANLSRGWHFHAPSRSTLAAWVFKALRRAVIAERAGR